MSDELFIALQCLLGFGLPLGLGILELVRLRRSTPAPVGGGDPHRVEPVVVRLPMGQPRALPTPANSDAVAYRHAA